MGYSPEQLASSGKESAHQKAIFAWSNMACYCGFEAANDPLSYTTDGHWQQRYEKKPICELKWLHHIPNGGARGDNKRSNQIRGAQLKAEGVKRGVADIFLPVARRGFSGFYIELKVGLNKTSTEQDLFGQSVREQGFAWEVCYGWENAVNLIQTYLEG